MSLAINAGSAGFPNDPGTPAAVTVGVDYAITNSMIVGAAFSYGQTKQSFSLGGDFKQTDIAGSLYRRLRGRPYWGRAIGTYGALNYDVNRSCRSASHSSPTPATRRGATSLCRRGRL